MKTNSLTHGDIAERARQIWESEGNPKGRDTEIWLNAEQQLSAPPASPAKKNSPTAVHSSPGPETAADRLTSETAAESVVEFNISPAIPDDAAVRAALQAPADSHNSPSPAKTAPQLAATSQARGTGTSQSTATPATDPAPGAPPAPHTAPPPSPAAAAAQTEQQKKSARAPQHGTAHAAPTKAPPVSGKPIWDKPHSS